MMLFSETRLQGNSKYIEIAMDGGYIYVDQAVYRQAVILDDRFEHKPSMLDEKVKFYNNQSMLLYDFTAKCPEPLNILAPFVQMIFDCNLQSTPENAVAALHAISRSLDFEAFTKAPESVRNEIKFTERDVIAAKDDWKLALMLDFGAEAKIAEAAFEKINNTLREFSIGLKEAVADALKNMVVNIEHEPVVINMNGGMSRGISDSDYVQSNNYSDEMTEDDIADLAEEDPFAALEAVFASMNADPDVDNHMSEQEELKANGEQLERPSKTLNLPEPEEEAKPEPEVEAEPEPEPELTPAQKALKLFGGLD